MLSLDVTTMSVATALVVIVGGAMFLLDTVVHAGSAAARVWSAGFLSGILAVLCYLVWAMVDDGWIATAIGNAAFVTTTGCMWLGCRTYNVRRMRWAACAVTATAVATLVAVIAAGPGGGDWAGAEIMFIALAVFAGFGAVESHRSPLGDRFLALGLTGVLTVQCAFYVARTAVFVLHGPESPFFHQWFGTVTTSIMTIALTIVAVVTVSVLRATERNVPGREPENVLLVGQDGFLTAQSFESVLGDLLQRASLGGGPLAVIALRIDELPRIATAFGPLLARDIEDRWRAGVHAGAPLAAILGESRSGSLLLGLPEVAEGAARRLARRLSQRLSDDLTACDSTIIPVLGVGVVLGHESVDAAAMVELAENAARRSKESTDTSMIVVDPSRPAD